MTCSSSNSHKYSDTMARLESVRLSPYQLAEARAQLLRAEAIADLVCGAWTASSALARQLKAAITRKLAALANRYAESAMRAAMRQRDKYLAQATDTADLERRLRTWQAPRYASHLN